MMKLVGGFVGAHDLRLVILAAVICALASLTSIELLRHTRRSDVRTRWIWLCVAAASGGSGIWATHFIAMVAYDPGVPSAYAVGPTILSLFYAIVLTGCGLALSLVSGTRVAPVLGGAVVGVGIAIMHYTGMAAFEIAGRIVWDSRLVAGSLASGVVFAALALPVALSRRAASNAVLGSALLLVAICSHHFIAMGAVTIVPDPTVSVAASSVPTSWIAVAVAIGSGGILLFAVAAVAIDAHGRRKTLVESERLRSLANAAFEGLLVCQGDRIVNANDSFVRLAGSAATNLNGFALSSFLPHEQVRLRLIATPDQPVESELRQADGTLIPVELITRSLDDASRPHVAVAVRDLRARKRAEHQIAFLALHDGLTGLANRTGFTARLDQAIEATAARRGKLALLYLDLDRFKEVNDLFGHAAGDTLLQDAARIVTGLLGEGQLMGRLGGDEFAVFAAIDHAAAAGRLAERILDALRREGATAGGSMIATSIGIAIYPDDAAERAQLLNHADTALYRAKSEGRGTFRFYEDRMGAEVRDRRQLEHDLRHAIARDQIGIVYQPKSNVDSGDVIGFEALLRWSHPDRGCISPAIFIPIAEETGLILQIGEWVLRQTCREAARWRQPLTVAVNVSAVQIHAPHFVRILEDALHEAGLPPDRFEIEITETALIRDPARALATLRAVKALGVGIAMDDFGTGYSSLSNLRQFPFDKIKIDRSFIKAVDSNDQAAAIVRSVLGLGRGLGLPVVAEGVETDQEFAFLRGEHCAEAQGYLLGRPAAIETFAEYTHGERPEPRRRAVA